MMDSPCAWAIWNDPGLFEKYIKYKNVTKLVWTQDLTILTLNHMTQYSNEHLFRTTAPVWHKKTGKKDSYLYLILPPRDSWWIQGLKIKNKWYGYLQMQNFEEIPDPVFPSGKIA
jgi:hypothetical protein